MKEDGNRLSFSIEKRNFVVNDLLTGNLVINVRGQFTISNISKEVIITHLENLQEALMTYNKTKPIIFKGTKLSDNESIVIRENSHLCWTISYNNESAEVKDLSITMSRGFDVDFVLRSINRILAVVVSVSSHGKYKSNIIRRISDTGMLVWKYKEHTAVCYEDNCNDSMMFDCLIDGIYYPFAIVMPNDDDTVSVYTSKYEEIMRVPMDDSISTYFSVPHD